MSTFFLFFLSSLLFNSFTGSFSLSLILFGLLYARIKRTQQAHTFRHIFLSDSARACMYTHTTHADIRIFYTSLLVFHLHIVVILFFFFFFILYTNLLAKTYNLKCTLCSLSSLLFFS